MMNEQAWSVFWYGMITALATGLGAIPFAFIKRTTPTVMGVANGVAAGLMAGASFGLLNEAAEIDKRKMLLGVVLGILFIGFTDWVIDKIKKYKLKKDSGIIEDLPNSFRNDFWKGLLIILIMTAHSAAEGIGIGTSFGGSVKFGILMTVAIAIHNIPEGLAISAVLVSKGSKWYQAALWSIITSLPQPLLAVPAFLFVSVFKPYVPIGLGLAAGAMIWLVFSEIAPESAEQLGGERAATVITFSLALMLFIQLFL